MTIEQTAQELIARMHAAAEAEREYARARDAMYNALASQSNGTYVSGGYKFIKTKDVEARTMTKQSVIEALCAAELPPDVISTIIGAALIETERSGGLRIIKSVA